MSGLLAKAQALWAKAYGWLKDKLGRVLMALGAAISAVDGFDITGIKEPLVKLLGEGRVAYLTVALFVAGFLRNQHVAVKYSALLKAHQDLQQQHAELQDAHAQLLAKQAPPS